MANTLFDKGRESFAGQNPALDWDTDNIKVMLVKSTYTLSQAHQYVSDLTPGTNDNGRSANLGTKTVTSGVCDAADTSLVATAAAACNALVILKDSGLDSTSPLIGYIDTATGLPFTPGAGQTVNIPWDNGTNRIFKL